ncbi:MAG: hypothetical protein JWM78_920 [Verrucomicrobiaceae bacterium]|nr:hypothetical protein [Verrucomicrobiaceae bacterium]
MINIKNVDMKTKSLPHMLQLNPLASSGYCGDDSFENAAGEPGPNEVPPSSPPETPPSQPNELPQPDPAPQPNQAPAPQAAFLLLPSSSILSSGLSFDDSEPQHPVEISFSNKLIIFTERKYSWKVHLTKK